MSSKRRNSTILSKSFREARRAGLNITISRLVDKAKQAQKMAMLHKHTTEVSARMRGWEREFAYENVFPNRRGVLIRISEGDLAHPFFAMIVGRATPHEWRYITLPQARMKALWNCNWCAERA